MVEVKTTNTSFTSHRRNISTQKLGNLIQTIKPSINNITDAYSFEATIKQLIKSFYDEFICKPIIIEFMEKIINDKDRMKYSLSLVDEIYNTGLSDCGGFIDLKEYNTNLKDEEVILIEKTIKQEKKLEILREETGTDSAVIINKKTKKVIKEFTRIVNNKDLSKYYTIIEASPVKVIVYDSPLTDEGRTFKILWKSNLSNRVLTTGGEVGGGSIPEIESRIENNGYCPNPRHLKGTVSSVISAYIRNNQAIIKKDVEYPGFFEDENNKISTINYNTETPSKEDLTRAVGILDKLVKHFKGSEDKLATVLKWGWISPFSYIKKSRGDFLPWLVMDGSAGTGKTILGRIILLLWNKIDETNDFGGSSFDTVARVGSRISQSTFPVLVNEPMGTFQNTSVVDMLKSAVERTTARGKYVNGRYTQIPSLAGLIFTTNQSLPNLDSIARRMHKITFHHNERKDEKQKLLFEEEFCLNNPINSPIKHLRHISYFFADEIIHDPKLLSEDWMSVTNMILERLYTDIGLEFPDWLKSFFKNITMEEFDNDQIEDIRIFLIDEINKATKQVKIYDENGYTRSDEKLYSEDLKTFEDLESRVWNVMNERLLSWASVGEVNFEKYIYFTQGFKKILSNKTEVKQSMKSIAELLGWKYQTIRVKNSNSTNKAIKIGFDEFLRFLYPDF